MDILQEQAALGAKAKELERQLHRKNDEIVDLKKRVKDLLADQDSWLAEKVRSNHLLLKVALEGEAKKFGLLKGQADSGRQQVLILEADKSKLAASLSNAQHQCELLENEKRLLASENSRLAFETDTLTTKLRELEVEKESSLMSDTQSIGDELTPAIREKIIRLEVENRQLKDGSHSKDLEQQLADATRLIEMLKQQVNDKTAYSEDKLVAETNRLKEAHQIALKEQEDQNDKFTALESELTSVKADLAQAQSAAAAINTQNSSLVAEKTKLEGYLQTAKSMIR